MNVKKTLDFVDKHMSDLLKDLQMLIRQPSISAKNEGIDFLLYTSPSPRDRQKSRMPSSA